MNKYTYECILPVYRCEEMQLYWKVKIEGKWTWRKAQFHVQPGPFDFVYEVLPYREDYQ